MLSLQTKGGEFALLPRLKSWVSEQTIFMRQTLSYKGSEYHKTIGFIELKTEVYTLNLKIIKSCARYQPTVKKIYKSILKILKKYYNMEESGYNIHKQNTLQVSRVSRARRIENDKRENK